MDDEGEGGVTLRLAPGVDKCPAAKSRRPRSIELINATSFQQIDRVYWERRMGEEGTRRQQLDCLVLSSFTIYCREKPRGPFQTSSPSRGRGWVGCAGGGNGGGGRGGRRELIYFCNRNQAWYLRQL